MRPIFVMTYDPHTALVAFTGPFDTEADAVVWGKAWQAERGDSPCWQTLSGYPTVSFTPTDSFGVA